MPNGSPIGPPDPRSRSSVSSSGASAGLKKSPALSDPSDWMSSRITESPSVPGVVPWPGPAGGAVPLPVAMKKLSGMSAKVTGPPPLCQMPAR